MLKDEDELVEWTLSEKEVQDLINWIESLSVIELEAIRREWTQRFKENQDRLQ